MKANLRAHNKNARTARSALKSITLGAVTAVALLASVSLPGKASASGLQNILVEASAECRKVNDKGCTAWANRTYTAPAGKVYVIPSSSVAITKSERCKVARNWIEWGGKSLINTSYGQIEVAKTATVYGECQSGSGYSGIGAVSKIEWKGNIAIVDDVSHQ